MADTLNYMNSLSNHNLIGVNRKLNCKLFKIQQRTLIIVQKRKTVFEESPAPAFLKKSVNPRMLVSTTRDNTKAKTQNIIGISIKDSVIKSTINSNPQKQITSELYSEKPNTMPERFLELMLPYQ